MDAAAPLLDAAVAPALLQGALMMAGLIVAIGAQNALVLRQGVRREHVLPVVALCTVSDWLLVALGVFGLGRLIAGQPLLLEVFRWGGAAFLIAYGAMAARRAWQARPAALAMAGAGGSLTGVLGSALAMTYLNPHVYLDTVVLVGSVGARHQGAAQLAFVAGAWFASAAWFALLGLGAAGAARWLGRPQVWRAIDALVAVVMWTVALQLLATPLRIA